MIDHSTLTELIAAKLITCRASKTYPKLSTVKYHRSVFYDGKWGHHPFLLEARGLVLDENLNVVVHPFTKVFNRNETPESDFPPDTNVLCVKKINGFLGVVTFTKDYGWVYSTTGSLDSDFIAYIKDHIKPIEKYLPSITGMTYLFEICHVDDPHIIVEECKPYLIGCRYPNDEMATEYELDDLGIAIGVTRPEHFTCTMREVNSIIENVTYEGVMVHELDACGNQTGRIIKMKSKYYLLLKLMARKKDLEKALTNAKQTKASVPEELYCVVDAIDANKEAFALMDEQERLSFMRKVIDDQ